MQALTSKALAFGGFTSTSLGALRADVYSTTGSSWTSETALPFTPGGGYVNSAQITGGADSRVYVVNGTSVWSRGDSSGTWRSETSLGANVGSGWGTVDSGGTKYLQFVSTAAPANYYQAIA